MSVEAEWERLVAGALVGTARGGASAPVGLVAQLADRDPEEQLLGGAAGLGLERAAGRRPRAQVGGPRIEPAPGDDRPACPARAARHLAALLRGHHADVLGEWCQTAAAAGCRAPDELLTALLRAASSRRDARLLLAIGLRGEWLARQNADWQALVADDDPERVWSTGTRTERLHALQSLRARDPDRARELVQTTWNEDGPDERECFVTALGVGLSLADEPFLEEALGDKRKGVRLAAAELLARLPGSRLAQRAAGRAPALLRFPPLEVALPDALDPALARDGIDPKRDRDLGERAAILCQLIAATPLGAWSFAAEPEPLLAAALASEWSRAVIAGLCRAAIRQSRSDWASALVRALCRDPASWRNELPRLLAALAAAEREAILLPLASESDGDVDRGALRLLLEAADHAWSAKLSRVVLRALARHFATEREHPHWAFRAALHTFALRLDPSAHAELSTPIPEALEEPLATLRFRAEMLGAFASSETGGTP